MLSPPVVTACCHHLLSPPIVTACCHHLLSPRGHSGTSCPAPLLSPPCDKLASFALLIDCNLISFTSYAKWGASSNIPSNMDCTCSMLWLMVYLFLFEQLCNVASSLMQIATFLTAHKNVYLSKNASLLASHNG